MTQCVLKACFDVLCARLQNYQQVKRYTMYALSNQAKEDSLTISRLKYENDQLKRQNIALCDTLDQSQQEIDNVRREYNNIRHVLIQVRYRTAQAVERYTKCPRFLGMADCICVQYHGME